LEKEDWEEGLLGEDEYTEHVGALWAGEPVEWMISQHNGQDTTGEVYQ
jgi:hypothetical protein